MGSSYASGSRTVRKTKPVTRGGRYGCVAVDIDGNVYTCDRPAHRLQVFDRMVTLRRTSPYLSSREANTQRQDWTHTWCVGLSGPGAWGTAVSVSFSRDREQKFMFVSNEDDEQVEILDRASGRILSSFGRAGHQVGELPIFTTPRSTPRETSMSARSAGRAGPEV